MNKSSNSTVSIIAGSLAVTGAVAAASLWSNFQHHRSSQHEANQKDLLIPKFIGGFGKLTPTDPEKLKQVINASVEYVYRDLPAHIIGDLQIVRKRTRNDREEIMQAVNALCKDLLSELIGNHPHDVRKGKPTNRFDQVIETFFKYFYRANKGASRSVSSQDTEDTTSISSSTSVSLEGMDVVETTESKNTESVNIESITTGEEKAINYDWDDEAYVETKGSEETPLTGSDAAALFLTGALMAAQSFA